MAFYLFLSLSAVSLLFSLFFISFAPHNSVIILPLMLLWRKWLFDDLSFSCCASVTTNHLHDFFPSSVDMVINASNTVLHCWSAETLPKCKQQDSKRSIVKKRWFEAEEPLLTSVCVLKDTSNFYSRWLANKNVAGNIFLRDCFLCLASSAWWVISFQ